MKITFPNGVWKRASSDCCKYQ